MSADLQSLCDGFCALAKIQSPQVQHNPDGALCFNIDWRDVQVDLVTQPGTQPHHVYVIFHMGTPDPAHGDFARILQALLQANFISMRENQPVFGCHPHTQGLTMQWVLPLSETSGEDLHRLIEQGLDLVLQWRQTYFLPSVQASSATQLECAAGYA